MIGGAFCNAYDFLELYKKSRRQSDFSTGFPFRCQINFPFVSLPFYVVKGCWMFALVFRNSVGVMELRILRIGTANDMTRFSKLSWFTGFVNPKRKNGLSNFISHHHLHTSAQQSPTSREIFCSYRMSLDAIETTAFYCLWSPLIRTLWSNN